MRLYHDLKRWPSDPTRKNFENRSIFRKVMTKVCRPLFDSRCLPRTLPQVITPDKNRRSKDKAMRATDSYIPGSPRSPGRDKPGSPCGPGSPLRPGSPGLPGGPTGPRDPGRPTQTHSQCCAGKLSDAESEQYQTSRMTATSTRVKCL